MRFAGEVGEGFDGLRLIAREVGDPSVADVELGSRVALSPLPDYRSLRNLARLVASVPGAARGMWRGIGQVDVVWVTGVHPFGLLAVALAGLRRRRVVLLIRQETLAYFRARMPSRAWMPLLGAVWLLEAAYRILAVRLPVTAVGPRIAARYGAPRPGVLQMRVTSLSAAELSRRARGDGEPGPTRLLSVGRIDREKDPLLAVRALAELERESPGAHELTWLGEGPMAPELRAEAGRLGVSELLHLPGFVAPGDELSEHYLRADALVLCSRTEGVPGVILEAQASGLPVVATAVGGVPGALEGGAAGLLVPPDNERAIADAVMRFEDDGQLRARLVARGRELAAGGDMCAEAARVATFIDLN
jgi:glycosyltransferase involved in cell wall biosynthesis